MIRCSICHTLVAPEDEVTDCPGCQQRYHASCWSELGGCGTYGCARAPAPDKPAPPAVVGAGWGDSKTCPACNAAIGSSKLVCGCGARFPYADAMTAAEYAAWQAEERAVKVAKRWLVALFVGSIVGFTAPLCGALAAVYGWLRRERLAGEHGTFLALACGSAALGLVYSVVMLLLVTGH
ncbi:MAG TPA: hypothetical protein VGJ32_09995 [Solirubrobacteraceae bacterium]|jgi:hypothetical protein